MTRHDGRDLFANLVTDGVQTVMGRAPVVLRVPVDGDGGRIGPEPESVASRDICNAQVSHADQNATA